MTPTYYLAVRLLTGNVLTLQGAQIGDVRAIRPVAYGAPDFTGADRPQYVGWIATDATTEQVNGLLAPVMSGIGDDAVMIAERGLYIDFDLVPDEIEERLLIPEIVEVDAVTLGGWLGVRG